MSRPESERRMAGRSGEGDRRRKPTRHRALPPRRLGGGGERGIRGFCLMRGRERNLKSTQRRERESLRWTLAFFFLSSAACRGLDCSVGWENEGKGKRREGIQTLPPLPSPLSSCPFFELGKFPRGHPARALSLSPAIDSYFLLLLAFEKEWQGMGRGRASPFFFSLRKFEAGCRTCSDSERG